MEHLRSRIYYRSDKGLQNLIGDVYVLSSHPNKGKKLDILYNGYPAEIDEIIHSQDTIGPILKIIIKE